MGQRERQLASWQLVDNKEEDDSPITRFGHSKDLCSERLVHAGKNAMSRPPSCLVSPCKADSGGGVVVVEGR